MLVSSRAGNANVRNLMRYGYIWLLLVTPRVLLAQDALPDAREAMNVIRPSAIEAHITFLADDLLEGRGTGTDGYLIAAKYVVAQLQALGLEPAGDNGTYFQNVPFRHSEPSSDGSSVTLRRDGASAERLSEGEDFYVPGQMLRESSTVEARVVFVGFGVTAESEGYDDYRGVNVEGKLVALRRGAPAHFESSVRAYYSDNVVKARNAASHGAVGIVTLWTPDAEAIFPWAVLGRFIRRGNVDWVGPDGAPGTAVPQIRGTIVLGARGVERLLSGSGMTAADLVEANEATELPAALELTLSSRHRALSSPNVIARLEGSDPSLRHERVVFTAHVDHEGLGEPSDGDAIYNGALDNASGTAALLEVARAFASLRERPRRSLLFIGTAAEEEGLLGAEYFARNPTVPLETIVANINMDGSASWYPPAEMIAYGSEHSTLGEIAQGAAAMLDLALVPDPAPEQVFFIRSDQYPFIKQGIPAIFFMVGRTSSDPSRDGEALFNHYLTQLYHTPHDELGQGLDFDACATIARLHFLVGYRVAQQEGRPSWLPGDFFGERFGKN